MSLLFVICLLIGAKLTVIASIIFLRGKFSHRDFLGLSGALSILLLYDTNHGSLIAQYLILEAECNLGIVRFFFLDLSINDKLD